MTTPDTTAAAIRLALERSGAITVNGVGHQGLTYTQLHYRISSYGSVSPRLGEMVTSREIARHYVANATYLIRRDNSVASALDAAHRKHPRAMQCIASKADGSRCKNITYHGTYYCPAHRSRPAIELKPWLHKPEPEPEPEPAPPEPEPEPEFFPDEVAALRDYRKVCDFLGIEPQVKRALLTDVLDRAPSEVGP